MVNRLERGCTIRLSPAERMAVLEKIGKGSVSQYRERGGSHQRPMVAAVRANTLGSYPNNFLSNDNETA